MSENQIILGEDAKRAGACPNCGAPIYESRKDDAAIGIIVTINHTCACARSKRIEVRGPAKPGDLLYG